jgi:hypothetical protein
VRTEVQEDVLLRVFIGHRAAAVRLDGLTLEHVLNDRPVLTA